MTVRVRQTSRGISIRFTGVDADRAFTGIAKAIGEAAANAPEPVPNRPKKFSVTLTASDPQNAPTALNGEND